jgi:hypothetical protein
VSSAILANPVSVTHQGVSSYASRYHRWSMQGVVVALQSPY